MYKRKIKLRVMHAMNYLYRHIPRVRDYNDTIVHVLLRNSRCYSSTLRILEVNLRFKELFAFFEVNKKNKSELKLTVF